MIMTYFHGGCEVKRKVVFYKVESAFYYSKTS